MNDMAQIRALRDRRGDRAEALGAGYQHAHVAVAQDVRDLLRTQERIHGNENRAGARGAEGDGDGFEALVEVERDARATADGLPFAEASFDVVLSTFGVMFTPDQEKAAAELARVCRPGGKIGLANWTPESFIGQLFKTIGRHVPPPAGIESPAMWGNRQRIQDLFGAQAAMVVVEPRHFTFRYRSPDHMVDIFKTYYGPVLKAFAALDASKQPALADDLMSLIGKFNRAKDGTMVTPSEYLEVVITKK